MTNNRRMFIFLILITGFGYLLGYIFKDEFSILIKNSTDEDIKNIEIEFLNFNQNYEIKSLKSKEDHNINLKELIPYDRIKNEENLNIKINIDGINYKNLKSKNKNIDLNIKEFENKFKIEIER